MTTALFAMSHEHLRELFPLRQMNRLTRLVEVDTKIIVRDFADPDLTDVLARTEILLSGDGCPPIDASVLDRMPWLRTILHAGGSIRGLVSQSCWERGIRVSCAVDASSIPAAEFALAAILFSGKDAFAQATRYRLERSFPRGASTCAGNFGRRVGVIGASQTGRRVIELLRSFEFDIVVHDPHLSADEATWLRVGYLPLDRLLATCDVVTLHAPLSPETRGLLDAGMLAQMPDGATLINTAHGELVHTPALTRELVSGRISAVLDVTAPQSLPANSPLYKLPNVFLTPGLAGSLGGERERIGRCVVDELERLLSGRPMLHRVLRADLSKAE